MGSSPVVVDYFFFVNSSLQPMMACMHVHMMCAHITGPLPVVVKLFTLLDLCVSSLRRGHANLLCIESNFSRCAAEASTIEVPVTTAYVPGP